MNDQLLAKSKTKDGRILSLEQHLIDAEYAATQIFALDKRWGKNWCRFFKIQNIEEQKKFLLNLRIADLFHDVGKANSEFQQAVSGGGFYAQSIRHEHISSLILLLPQVRQWLENNSNIDFDVITAAVLSHHLKASKFEGSDYEWCIPKGKLKIDFFLDSQEIINTFERVREITEIDIDLPEIPSNAWNKEYSSQEFNWQNLRKQGRKIAEDFKKKIRKNQKIKSLYLAVKAGLIVSDSLASAKFREELDLEKWIEKYIHQENLTVDFIDQKILIPFKNDYFRRKEQRFELRKFQKEVAKKGFRVLFMTACGSGKTIGGWEWLKEQCKQFEIGKLIFLYPTRATALQGFIGYTAWGGDNAAHLSGTAQYELETLLENPTESTQGQNFQLSESEARLYALGYWGKRFISGTVDQFMSFLEHNYRAMCLLPVLADAAIVLDEVHSYDKRMFNSLIAFLKEFDIPVLCMTATLPNIRQQQLIEQGLTKFPLDEERFNYPHLQVTEDKPRYQIEIIDETEAFDKALKAYKDNNYRVLWVVNQVKKCQNKADFLERELQKSGQNTKVISYHSQFLLGDRQKQHQEIIRQFSPPDAPEQPIPKAISVTTQVCEMSLDLDADVLITELANICALVQRFGRANRHISRSDNYRAKIYVYKPKSDRGQDDILPYSQDEINIAWDFICELANMGDVNQRQLAEKLETHSGQEPLADGWTRFLSQGYFATPGDYRDIDAYRKTCVLDRDIKGKNPLVLERINSKKAFDDLTIGVPNKQGCILDLGENRPSWLPKWLGVAPADKYCSYRGFRS